MKQRNLIVLFFIVLLSVVYIVNGAVNTDNKQQTEKERINEFKSKSIKKLNRWSKFFVKQNAYHFQIEKKVIKDSDDEIIKESDRKEDEYGVFAIDNKIKAGMELLGIKWTSCLTIDTIQTEQNEMFNKMVDLKLAQEDILMVGLLIYKECMKKENYNLKDWVQSLPNSYESALYFNEDELEYLSGSPAFVSIMVEKEIATELYKQLSDTLFKDQEFLDQCTQKTPITWDQFKWSYATITARKIYVTDPQPTLPEETVKSADGKETTPPPQQQQALAPVVPPVVDFFNHATHPTAEIDYNEELGTIDVRAVVDVKKGQELFVNYDHHYCGSDLLVDYGYLNNKIDDSSCVNVLIEELLETIREDDPIKADKLYLIDKLSSSKETKLKISMDSLTEDLLKISKYMAYQTESLLEYLRTLVTLKINHYPTTIEQDKEFLLTSDYKQLSPRSKLAFHLCYQEKQILSNVNSKLLQNINSSPTATSNPSDNDNANANSAKKVKDEL